jgi:CBS domain-containing protein
MNSAIGNRVLNRLVLEAGTAQDVMTPNPVSVSHQNTIREAAAVLINREISAVAVIDDADRPIGVVSCTDLVRYLHDAASGPEVRKADAAKPVAAADVTTVRAIMTPAVLSVTPETPLIDVVAQMLGLGRVHRLFVIDESGVLVGVISASDVLRKLRAREHF